MMHNEHARFLFGTMSTIDQVGAILTSILFSSVLPLGTPSGAMEVAKE